MHVVKVARQFVTVLVCSISLVTMSVSVAAARPIPPDGPQYLICSITHSQLMGSNSINLSKGTLTVSLYRLVDSHIPSDICGYQSEAYEDSGPAATLYARVYQTSSARCDSPIVDATTSKSSSGTATLYSNVVGVTSPPLLGDAVLETSVPQEVKTTCYSG